MKILFATDIESDFNKLEIFGEYAKESKPDLIMVCGDLMNVAYRNENYFERHQVLAELVGYYMTKTESGLKRLTPYEMTRAIPIVAEKMYEYPPSENLEGLIASYIGMIQDPKAAIIKEANIKFVLREHNVNNLEKLAEAYLRSLDFLEGNMDIHYDLIKSIMDKFGLDFRTLPGNHDKYLELTVLKENDLHKKTLEKDGVIISCFGGASDFQYGDIVPFGTPAEITMPFNEYPNRMRQTVSEIFNFLIKEKPDVAFTHIPPRGFGDLTVNPSIRHQAKDPQLISALQQGGPTILAYIQENPQLRGFLREAGSLGLTRYLRQGDTKIVCCGHIHESVGVKKMKTDNGPVIVFNGGSLRDGYFGEVFIDDETQKLDKIALYQIKGKLILPGDLKETLDIHNVKLLMEYFLTPQDELKKIKIDLNDPFDY